MRERRRGKAWILLGLNGLNSGLTEHHSTEETARREGSWNYFNDIRNWTREWGK